MNEVELILKLIATVLPSGVSIINDIRALFKKYPELTPEQFAAIVVMTAKTADADYDALIADIKRDQAAHPLPPK